MAAAVSVVGVYRLLNSALPTLEDLESALTMPVPPEAVLVDSTGKVGPFESARAWLIEIPVGQERKWRSQASRFRECERSLDRSSDYADILHGVQEYFPAQACRFKQPRIWLGGKDGNCQMAESDDGRLVFVFYFTT